MSHNELCPSQDFDDCVDNPEGVYDIVWRLPGPLPPVPSDLRPEDDNSIVLNETTETVTTKS
jgi:hypothetical protein